MAPARPPPGPDECDFARDQRYVWILISAFDRAQVDYGVSMTYQAFFDVWDQFCAVVVSGLA